MTKKKRKQRRQHERQQKRAARTAKRHKQSATVPSVASGPVLFDQDEAAAIASMMTGGSSQFAARFGSVLLDTDQLLGEAEFAGLSLDPEQYLQVVSPLIAEYDPALSAVDQDDLHAKDELWLEIRGQIVARLVQTGFRDELLDRLNQFIERTRGDAGLEDRWRSAVALKFLLEQPPAGDASRIWSGCQLMLSLIADIEQVIARNLTLQDTVAAVTGRRETLSVDELFDALENPDVLEKLSDWMAKNPPVETDADLLAIQEETLSALIDGEWLPELYSLDQLAVFGYTIVVAVQTFGIDAGQSAFPLLDIGRQALDEIVSPEWCDALMQRIRQEQRAALGHDKEQLERWLALELMTAGFEEEPAGSPALLAALISQHNAVLQDDGARARLRAAIQRRNPGMTPSQLDDWLE